jgi:hypothetical protein
LKIRLEELTPCLSGEGSHQDIAVIAYKKTNALPFYFSPKKKEFFDFRDPVVSQLSVSIWDEKNQLVEFTEGITPIVVTFKLQHMDMESNVMRLSSKQSTKYFPNNSPSSFRILLGQSLDSARSYEVALSSIFLPPNKLELKTIVSNWGGLYITVGEDRFDFIDDLNTVTTRVFMEAWLRHLQASTHETSKNIAIRPRSQTYEEYQVINNSKKDDIVITMSYLCAYLFRFDLHATKRGDDVSFKLMKRVGVKTLGNMKIDNCRPSVIMLHCNFIETTPVGNDAQRILKVFPYKKENGEEGFIRAESAQLEFLPVLLNENNLLHFELRDVYGHPIPFENPASAEVFLNLIFREK